MLLSSFRDKQQMEETLMDASTQVATQTEVEKAHSGENPVKPATQQAAFPPATLFGTHVRNIPSAIVDQEYEISVMLPPDYDTAPEKSYPVAYILDGDYGFSFTAHSGYFHMVGGDLPPMIIIGIGWHIQSFDDWSLRRNRDFVPEPIDMLPGSGGAANFLSFIEMELLPFVNANYRTDPTNQTLVGASGGGFFALYALLQKPGLFRGIVSGSPGHWVRPSILSDIERQFAETGKPLPANVYISFGGLEEDWCVKPAEEFYHLMESRNYAGLSLKYELLDGETHTSVLARAMLTGLRHVFKTSTGVI
jgi:predicted alpha/beta superfamily hydrolase